VDEKSALAALTLESESCSRTAQSRWLSGNILRHRASNPPAGEGEVSSDQNVRGASVARAAEAIEQIPVLPDTHIAALAQVSKWQRAEDPVQQLRRLPGGTADSQLNALISEPDRRRNVAHLSTPGRGYARQTIAFEARDRGQGRKRDLLQPNRRAEIARPDFQARPA
jgi:hypothetical protein